MRLYITILLILGVGAVSAQEAYRFPDDLYRNDKPELQVELNKAITLYKYGSAKRAAKTLQRSLAAYPYHYDARVLLGYLYYDMRKFEEAAAQFNRAAQIYNGDPGLFFIRGNCYLWLHRYAAAYDNYLKCLWLEPNYAGAHNNIAVVRLQFQGIDEPHKNEILKARDDIYQVIQNSTVKDAKMLFNMGLIQLHLSAHKEAVKYFDETIQYDNAFAKAYFFRGLSYYYQRVYDRARYDFDIAGQLGFETERCQEWLKHLDKVIDYLSQRD